MKGERGKKTKTKTHILLQLGMGAKNRREPELGMLFFRCVISEGLSEERTLEQGPEYAGANLQITGRAS